MVVVGVAWCLPAPQRQRWQRVTTWKKEEGEEVERMMVVGIGVVAAVVVAAAPAAAGPRCSCLGPCDVCVYGLSVVCVVLRPSSSSYAISEEGNHEPNTTQGRKLTFAMHTHQLDLKTLSI